MQKRQAEVDARDEAVREMARSIAKYRMMKKAIIGNVPAAIILGQLRELREKAEAKRVEVRAVRGEVWK